MKRNKKNMVALSAVERSLRSYVSAFAISLAATIAAPAVHAQNWDTYGEFNNCYSGTVSLSFDDYFDNNRARVTSIGTSAGNTILTWDPAHKHGNFTIGHRVIWINMSVTGSRNYQVGKIMNVNNTTHELTIQGTSFSYVNSVPAGNMVQVIEYDVYYNLTVQSGGVVTCHEWDGYTGGVVYFEVCNLLTMNGGKIDASGKGYRPYLSPN